MSNHQRETLEDRLAKRRRLRHKRYFDTSSTDESEITLVNHSPTTQSLDRKSSHRTTPGSIFRSPAASILSAEQRKLSSTISRNSELPPIDSASSRQYYQSANRKTNSTPLLPQVTKYQSFEWENEKQASLKSIPVNEQQQTYAQQNEAALMIKEIVSPVTTIEKSSPVQPDIVEHSDYNEKPVVMKETATSILSSTTMKKSNAIPREIPEDPHLHQNEKSVMNKEDIIPILPSITAEKSIRGNSVPNPIRSFPRTLGSDHPSSHPQSTTDHQQKHFNYPPLYPKPIPRATSEQIVSTTKPKQPLSDSTVAKQNSLALSYLFNKRMIGAVLARAPSLDAEQAQQKTVWD